MTFVDTSPEKFYDSLLSWEEAAAEEGASLIEPPPIEEPEEVAPGDYKVLPCVTDLPFLLLFLKFES